MDAMQRSDSDKWLGAMKFKVEFMEINGIWILVDPFEGIKLIRSKWIFKKKKSTDEKVRPMKPIWLPRGIVNVMVLTMMRVFSYSMLSELEHAF